MAQGTVSWFDETRGFGFLAPDDGGPDVFVHARALPDGGTLEPGQRVAFDVREGDRGLQADRVRVLDDGPPGASRGGRDTGTVSWFDADKGFGFLAPDDGGSDVFVHFSEIAEDGFKTLEEGQRVEYDVHRSDRGPQAQQVVVLREDAVAAPQAPERDGPEVVLGGVLTWLDDDKGYGFITPDDLFVHVSALEGRLEQGDRVEFVVRPGERGPQAEQVGAGRRGAPGREDGRPPAPVGGRVGGTVAWYDEAKGFGFLSPDDRSGDVFVHARAVVAAPGEAPLAEGERVEFGVRQGDRGPQAEDVRRTD